MREILFCALIGIIVFSGTISGCRSVTPAGDESLVEARILTAVNAERARWTEELSQRIGDGLRQVDQRVNAVEGGLQQVAVAAGEYRKFVLELIDSLQHVEGEESELITGPLDSGNPFLY